MNKNYFKNKYIILTAVFMFYQVILMISLSWFGFHSDTSMIKSGNYYIKTTYVGATGIKKPVYDISISDKDTKRNISENKKNEITFIKFRETIFKIKSYKFDLLSWIPSAIYFVAVFVLMLNDKRLNHTKLGKIILIALILSTFILATYAVTKIINKTIKAENNLVTYYNSIN